MLILLQQPKKSKTMKTRMNISNLKKLSLTVFASLVMVTPNLRAEDNESASAALINLEIFMSVQAQSLKYVAPAYEMEDVTVAMDRLENFADMSEASLKYEAPAVDEMSLLHAELERLELLAAETEVSLTYKAPVEDENVETVPALERLEMLAEATEASLKYEAPVIVEGAYDLESEITNNMMAETK